MLEAGDHGALGTAFEGFVDQDRSAGAQDVRHGAGAFFIEFAGVEILGKVQLSVRRGGVHHGFELGAHAVFVAL